MIECSIPQDILKYKAKFIGNFTVRESVFVGLGLGAAAFGFFYLFKDISGNAKMYAIAAIALPFFAFGFVKPLGQPLEKILWQVIYDNFLCPPVRKYEIHFPEYEKYRKGVVSEVSTENPNGSTEEIPPDVTEEEGGASKRKKKKAKPAKSKEKAPAKKDKKIAKSKEYPAIR